MQNIAANLDGKHEIVFLETTTAKFNIPLKPYGSSYIFKNIGSKPVKIRGLVLNQGENLHIVSNEEFWSTHCP